MSISHTMLTNLCRILFMILWLALAVRQPQWLLAVTLQLTPTPIAGLPPKAKVNVPTLNVREGPGVEYQRVTIVTKDDELAVTGQTANCSWLKISSPQGIAGWVSAQFVILNLPCNDLVVLAPPSSSPEAEVAALLAPRSAEVAQSGIILIQPLDSLLRGRVTFAWESRNTLAENQAFELVFWLPGGAPLESGFSPVGASSTTKVVLDLDQVADDLPQLQPGQDYKWGVLLVSTSPYQRLRFLGAEHQFRFERGNTSSLLLPTPAATPTAIAEGGENNSVWMKTRIETPTLKPSQTSTSTPKPPPTLSTGTRPGPTPEPRNSGKDDSEPSPESPGLNITVTSASARPTMTPTPKPTSTPIIIPTATSRPTDVTKAATPKPTLTVKPTDAGASTPKPTAASTAPSTATAKPTAVDTPTPKPTSAPTEAVTTTPKPTTAPDTPTPQAATSSKAETPTRETPTP